MIDFEIRCDTAEEFQAAMRDISPTNIYDDVDDLKAQMSEVRAKLLALDATVETVRTTAATTKSDLSNLKIEVDSIQPYVEDTGWIAIPLSNGVIPYSDNASPQVRRIGKTIFVRGAVKNVLEACTIGVLPAEFRPTRNAQNYIQNTSFRNPYLGMSARIAIKTNGEIVIEGIQDGASWGESKWFPLNTSYAL